MAATKEELLSTLEDIASLLVKTQTNIKKCPKSRLTKGYLEARLLCVEDYWFKFKDTHHLLVKLLPTKDLRANLPYFVKEEFFRTEDLFLNIQGDLKDLLEPHQSQKQGDTSTYLDSVSEDRCLIKLPRIELPKFAGNYEEWPTYQDMFVSMVHNNNSLSSVAKLQYLKRSLSGEAENLLKQIPVTEKNYELAWNKLKKRYGNTKAILNAVLKRLFTQRKITVQSGSQVKSLLDTTNECLHSLRNLNVNIEAWDPIIIYVVVQKLDPETHKDWEQFVYNEDETVLPTWTEMIKFLESTFRTLELARPTSATSTVLVKEKPTKERSFAAVTDTATATKTCFMCNEAHTICHCKAFSNMTVPERGDYVRKNNLCYNCLSHGHAAHACRIPVSCRICKRRHHSLLHATRNTNSQMNAGDVQTHHSNMEPNEEESIEEEEEEESDILVASHFAKKNSTALLATALVPVRTESGETTILRALVDQGSQATFVSERAAQLLKLNRTKIEGTVTGVGGTKSKISHVVQLEVLSRREETFNLKIKAYVMPTRLTTQLPSKTIHIDTWGHLNGLSLADPSFNQPGRIDMLLGVEVCAQILKSSIIKGPPGTPCAQDTRLGWILFGKIEDNNARDDVVVMHHQIHFDTMLKNMWELETTEKQIYTKEEKQCEEIYNSTVTRNEEGRYIVTLPKKHEKLESTKGGTRDIALKRLNLLEKRFDKNTKLKEEYRKVMEEYKETGHMEEVPEQDKNKVSVYLPHHAVIKEEKETTKVRIVFDASAKGKNEVSLNEELLVGPQLQEDMRNIIMRWRMKPICFIADIQKMYRQILVARDDTDYQRILWRDNKDEEVKDFRLLRVTFGTASAPYLAVRTLQQVAEDEGKEHTNAQQIIKEDFYMDDLMSGKDSVGEAITVAKDVAQILEKGGFTLQKWCSNSSEFLQEFDPQQRSIHANVDIKVDGTVKALGLTWNMGQDAFRYNITLPPAPEIITKRNIFSDIQRLFDPLGWFAPALVPAKLLIQSLWLDRINWDQEVTTKTKQHWLYLRDSYQQLNEIEIERWLQRTETKDNNVSIHGFCDASTKAYAAVAYLRVENEDGDIKVGLIAAKSRVAPVKPVSLPRLELCGAVLLSRLLKQIREATRISPERIFSWTDSTVVLSWLLGDPIRWQTFVRNRVVEVLDNVGNQWYHVKTHENPADVGSRGMSVKELKECKLWWGGPEWLKVDDIQYTRPENITTTLERRETIQTNLKMVENKDNETSLADQFGMFSNLSELLKSMAICRRFIQFKRSPKTEKSISTEELDKALKTCIKIEQTKSFLQEINCLINKRAVRRDSRLKALNPFLDAENILRVGGRLRHANIDEDNKFPMILDNSNDLTKLMVADAHLRTLHGGVQLMLGFLRTKYWILRAKSLVKRHIRKCMICARQSAKCKPQIMGDLPKVRVTPERPFLNSAVDFAGPYNVLMSKGRGVKTYKAYIAVFVCMVTKAIHLELVGDITSEAFIGAYKRFVSRRGKCCNMWSDQGRTFIGANKELAKAWAEANFEIEDSMKDALVKEGTQWHFIPAYSPNFGGLWEAGVKSMKYHLKRIMTNNLTFEEMATLLCEVEACLNSRPLSPIDHSDIDSIAHLTPGHFLIGEAPTTIPVPDLRSLKLSRLTRWQYLQRLLRDFWEKWQQEYLSRLQQRPKWTKREKELEKGTIVLIKMDNIPPGKWSMGRIMDKHPGPDGITRVYSVKSGDSVVKRSITKLCPLPVDVEDDND